MKGTPLSPWKRNSKFTSVVSPPVGEHGFQDFRHAFIQKYLVVMGEGQPPQPGHQHGQEKHVPIELAKLLELGQDAVEIDIAAIALFDGETGRFPEPPGQVHIREPGSTGPDRQR
jgi:hypothetical protein